MTTDEISISIWTGTIELRAIKRTAGGENENVLSVSTENFDIVSLVEVLKRAREQSIADAVIYGLVGQLEELQIELLTLWGDWRSERDNFDKSGN